MSMTFHDYYDSRSLTMVSQMRSTLEEDWSHNPHQPPQRTRRRPRVIVRNRRRVIEES